MLSRYKLTNFEEKQRHDKKIHILSCGRLVHVKNTSKILNFIQKFESISSKL